MNLNNLFAEFFLLHFGPLSTRKCLLAVSGGVDSMAMIELFRQTNANIGVAHCNFSLRGNESDLDNELVMNYCKQHNITFHEQRFDTSAFASEHHVSIQMAAREIRYKWFAELAERYSYDFIATAHHQNDNAETLLLNIIRGTGLHGLTGIPLQNNNIIRPLLFATKEQLESYVKEQNVPYREDASNSENKYARNKVRNEIIPLLQHINPQAISHLNALSEYAGAAYALLQKQMDEIKEKYTSTINKQVHIDLRNILLMEHSTFVVFELVKEYGFNSTQVADMIVSFSQGNTGRLFYSGNYKLIIDRNAVIVSPHTQEEQNETIITSHSNQQVIIGQQTFVLEYLVSEQLDSFQQNHIYLDAGLITLPFTIRKWKHGDRFKPIGLNGMKKVSDFLIDEKVNLIDKDTVLVLESEASIAAILNYRTAEQFKITSGTKHILHIYVL